MEFSAGGGPGRKRDSEELHGGGNYHRQVPSFCGLGQGGEGLWCGFVLEVIGDAGVVFQNGLFPQNVSEGLGGLLDDGGVGDHIDHPAQPPYFGPGPGRRPGRPRSCLRQWGTVKVKRPGSAAIPPGYSGPKMAQRWVLRGPFGEPAGDVVPQPFPQGLDGGGQGLWGRKIPP